MALARAGGIVAYILLTAVVLVGLAMSGRERIDGWPRFALEDVHRFLGALTGLFISLHVFTLAIDAEANLPLGLADRAVRRPRTARSGPGSGSSPPSCCSRSRSRTTTATGISYRTWRRLHYLNFAVWIGATAHGLGAGTDTGSFRSRSSTARRSRASSR